MCPLLSSRFLKLKTYSAFKRLGSLGLQIFKDLEVSFIIVLIFFVCLVLFGYDRGIVFHFMVSELGDRRSREKVII